MTVSASNPVISYTYTGLGNYSFDFRVFEETDLEVSLISTAGEVQGLTYGTEYSVTLVEGVEGGTVVVSGAGLSGAILEIKRDLPVTQEMDFVNNDPLNAETLEQAFDKLTMLLQQFDAVLANLTQVIVWRGDWVSGAVYEELDVVTGPDTSIYLCRTAHTAGTFATDLAAGKWLLAADLSSATAAAAAALVSEANAGVSEDNAANCAGAAYTSAANASNSATLAYNYKLSAEVAKDEAVAAATVFTLFTLGTSGSVALDPDNGMMQMCSASGTVTFTDSFATGQHTRLRVNRNNQTIVWPTITWMSGSPPSLSTLNWHLLEFWKEGSVLYGALVA